MSLSPKDVANFDQASKAIIDGFPGLWWGLYKNCMEQGFSKEQALFSSIPIHHDPRS